MAEFAGARARDAARGRRFLDIAGFRPLERFKEHTSSGHRATRPLRATAAAAIHTAVEDALKIGKGTLRLFDRTAIQVLSTLS